MSEWQPIETAPKDGTELILAFSEYNRPVLGHFCDSEDFQYGKSVRTRQYWSTGMINFMRDNPNPTPTHWMPLPEMPNMEDKQ